MIRPPGPSDPPDAPFTKPPTEPQPDGERVNSWDETLRRPPKSGRAAVVGIRLPDDWVEGTKMEDYIIVFMQTLGPKFPNVTVFAAVENKAESILAIIDAD